MDATNRKDEATVNGTAMQYARPIAWAATAGLLALTVLAVLERGYVGIFALQLSSFAGAQVLFDLVIALVMVLVWLRGDARRTGRAFLPWLLITLAAGSFGPLLYLCLGGRRRKSLIKSEAR